LEKKQRTERNSIVVQTMRIAVTHLEATGESSTPKEATRSGADTSSRELEKDLCCVAFYIVLACFATKIIRNRPQRTELVKAASGCWFFSSSYPLRCHCKGKRNIRKNSKTGCDYTAEQR